MPPAPSPTNGAARESFALALGARLRKARTRAGLTQRAAAEIVGVSAVSCSQHENGLTSPRSHVLLAYSRAYGVTADALLRGAAATNGGIAFEHAGRDLISVRSGDVGGAQLGLLRRVRRRPPSLWRPDPSLAEFAGVDLADYSAHDLHLTQAAWADRLNLLAQDEGGGRDGVGP